MKVVVDGERVIATAEGNGPVHALDAALRQALRPHLPWTDTVSLADYKVIRQRLQSRYAGTGFSPRNPNGWLLTAVERWGCEKAECEHGQIWETGERCERCFFLREESRKAKLREWRAAHPQEAEAGDLYWAAKRAQLAREDAGRARLAHAVREPVGDP